jgi:hypothetical protein
MAAVFAVLAIVIQVARGRRPLRLALPARERVLSPPP